MTYDQRIASDPAISVWVSANAGTGKTKVLTDRVLRLLLAGSKPDKILCITYTKAAAAEMEQRIEVQLGQWAIIPDKELHDNLHALTGEAPDDKIMKRARQLFALVVDAPQRMRIQTIHSFCQYVLKKFPLEAGVAPHFTIIEEYTSAELLAEAKTELFSQAGDTKCETDIEALAGMISEPAFNDLIASIISSLPKFGQWFSESSGAEKLRQRIFTATGTPSDNTAEKIFARHFSYHAEEIATLKATCTALAKSASATDEKFFHALQRWLIPAPDYRKANEYAAVYFTDKNAPKKNLSTKEAERHMPGLKELLRNEQDRCLAYAREMRALQTAQATCHVVNIAECLLMIYRRLKDSHGYMDYEDIIAHTVELLYRKGAAAWVLYKLDNGIDHLLVDEAQDTSPAQWKLVEALTEEFFSGEGAKTAPRSLFVVGDSKQSIFSFQGADPHSFDDMQSRLRRRIAASKAEFRNVQLALSFRSTEPVLRAVDQVFSFPAARNGLIFSESDISHEAFRKGMAGRVELWPLVEADDPDDLPDWYVAEKQYSLKKPEAMLAEQIALQIRQWLDEKRMIESQARPVQPGDILILVQRRGAFASAMMHALKENDISVAGADRLILTSHIAVEDCIALANFLLLPDDDFTLATVLKSPFVGLSEEDIFELAYGRDGLSLWQRLHANAKFAQALAYLADLLAHVDYLPPYELFAYILETKGGRKKLAGRLGEEIDDPLNEFLSLAIRYSEIYVPSLQGFLHWIQSGETEIKRDMEKTRNEVRIMTAHGAKGLQAPIVFLPDTTRMPVADRGNLLWMHAEMDIPFWVPSVDTGDDHYVGLRESAKLEREREYRRLLYVAMTRAEDELYICGWRSKRGLSESCWYELVRQAAESWQEEDGKRIIASTQTATPKIKPVIQENIERGTIPDWVNNPPAPEQQTARPLSPSQINSVLSTISPPQDQTARIRGSLIHKLLQYLPDIAPEKRQQAAERFIARYGKDFSHEAQEKIQKEVMNVILHPDFAPVFSTDSVAEAPVSGIVHDTEGRRMVISGQIDRLAVLENDVYIIDYKTALQIPATVGEIPLPYIRQVEAYRKLVKDIYPDKTVHCGILWTALPTLMLIN